MWRLRRAARSSRSRPSATPSPAALRSWSFLSSSRAATYSPRARRRRRRRLPPTARCSRAGRRVAARGDAVVVGGFCERGADGRVFNSSALVDGGGVRAVYRKLHLWADESPVVRRRRSAGTGRRDPLRPDRAGDLLRHRVPRAHARARARRRRPARVADELAPRSAPAGRAPVLHSLAAMTGVPESGVRGRVRSVRHGAGPGVRGRQRDRGPRRRAPRRPGRATGGTATLFASCDLTDARDKRHKRAQRRVCRPPAGTLRAEPRRPESPLTSNSFPPWRGVCEPAIRVPRSRHEDRVPGSLRFTAKSQSRSRRTLGRVRTELSSRRSRR